VSAELRALIRRISLENPLWGAPRIHGELLKLGYDVCESTIAKYMMRLAGPPSQTWQTFIRNHMIEIIAIDFFKVPTITFRTLYVFLILSLDRRRIIHFNLTRNPTAEWISLQLIQAFPFDAAPSGLSRPRTWGPWPVSPSSVDCTTATIAKPLNRRVPDRAVSVDWSVQQWRQA
jgi:putative transposase